MKQLKLFLLIAAALAGLMAAALWFVAGAWLGFGEETGISLNGLLALMLGCVLTFALGVGLMALVFYSNRSGHDALNQDAQDAVLAKAAETLHSKSNGPA